MSPQAEPDHQQRVDRMIAHVRGETASAGGVALFETAPPFPARSHSLLDQRMAEEIETIRETLERLGDILSADMDLLQRHARELQSIDLMHQKLGHLARVAAAADKPLAIEQVSLQDLRDRLRGGDGSDQS